MNIPGYYFDEQRGRYFRITNTGQSAGAQAEYSKSAVAAKKRNKRRKKTSRSPSTAPPTKRHKRPVVVTAPSFPRQFIVNQVIDPHFPANREEFCLATALQKTRTITTRDSSAIDRVAFNHSSKELYIGLRNGVVVAVSNLEDTQHTVLALGSPISGLQYSEHTLFITSQGGACMEHHHHPLLYIGNEFGEGEMTPTQQLEHGNLTLWCSSFVHLGGGPNTRLIAGMGETVWLNYRVCDSETIKQFVINSDVLAVDIDSVGFTIGCRNGKIYAARHDSRHRQILKHPSPVTHLKRLQPRFLLVSGIFDSFCLYDIKQGKPVVEYKEYCNRSTMVHGFATNPDNTFVAVGCDDGTTRIWNIYTGKLVRELTCQASAITWALDDHDDCLFIAHANTISIFGY